MTIPIALTLLFVFTTTVAILITVWARRANTRAEKITTVQARHIEQIECLEKKNEPQLWCMVDGKLIPLKGAVKDGHVKVEVRYDTCGDEDPELWERELDAN